MKLTPLNPIDEILESAGIGKKAGEGNNLREIMDRNGLSLEATIQQLATVAMYSDEDSTKLRALDTSLKLHKVLDPDVKQVPQVTVVIQSVSSHDINGMASILLPRETPQLQESVG